MIKISHVGLGFNHSVTNEL